MKTQKPLNGRNPTTFRTKRGLSLLCSIAGAMLLPAIPPTAVAVEAAPATASAGTKAFNAPLFSGSEKRLAGALAGQDLYIRLPEHIRYVQGSELVLSFVSSPILLPDISTLSVSLNDRPVTSIRLGQTDPTAAPQRKEIHLPLDASALIPGWNRLSLRCLLQTTYVPCRDVDNPAAWISMDSRSHLRVAYEPQSLFPELQRFPDSLAEPALMNLGKPEGEKPKSQAAVALLVPDAPTESDLRAFLIGTARLAQTLYLDGDSIAIGDTGDFAGESKRRNGILIGTAKTLKDIALAENIADTLSTLLPGEGCLAEIITGSPSNGEHRWLILSGGDAEGLERAAMALGSSPAIGSVPSNPWIIRTMPAVPVLTEQLAHPSRLPVAFQSMPDGGVTLRGLFRNEADRQWSFPPGYQIAAGSVINLDLSHAENLDKTSALDVRLNDVSIGSVALTAENAAVTQRRIPVPEGIPGRDPSRIQLASYLDIGTVDCGHRNDERAWLNVAASSTLNIQTEPLKISDLSRLDLLLMRDAFLRRAVVMVPAENDWERVELLKSLGVFLGAHLPSMPVLWPQVATYGPGNPPQASRVANRSGLVLGSVFQWSQALPEKTRLAVKASDEKQRTINLRGEVLPASSIESTLCLAQLLVSPWTKGELLATVGGVEGLGGEAAVALLTKPTVRDRLTGTVAAVDTKDRVVAYDARYLQPSSLAEHIEEGLPDGLSLEETEKLQKEKAADGLAAISNNHLILGSVAFTLFGIFALQRVASRRKVNGNGNNKADGK